MFISRILATLFNLLQYHVIIIPALELEIEKITPFFELYSLPLTFKTFKQCF